MKAILVILFLLLIAIALYLGLSTNNVAPPAGGANPTAPQNASVPSPTVAPAGIVTSNSGTGAEITATATPAAAPAPSTGKPAEGLITTTVQGMGQVADYATGYTPLKVKQRSAKKINDINAAHNADLEKAINDN